MSIKVGDTVIVNGYGTADSYGGGSRTKVYSGGKAKVIRIIEGRERPYALNLNNNMDGVTVTRQKPRSNQRHIIFVHWRHLNDNGVFVNHNGAQSNDTLPTHRDKVNCGVKCARIELAPRKRMFAHEKSPTHRSGQLVVGHNGKSTSLMSRVT
jgi:hypothetical protein